MGSFLERPLIITDLETTGLDPEENEILEFGAVKLKQDTLDIVEEFETKVHPQRPSTFSEYAIKLNGYSPDLWRDAVSQSTAIRAFDQFAQFGVVLAQSITFDWGFLNSTWKRECPGELFRIERHRMDLASMSWLALYPLDKVNLSVVAERLGIGPEPKPHRAITGARYAARVLRALLERIGKVL